MSPKLSEILQQAETLPADEQLQLIACLVQNLRQITSDQPEVQPDLPHLSAVSKSAGKSIWQLAEDFVKDLPESELAKLPADGAEQHDHYIYGTPKVEG